MSDCKVSPKLECFSKIGQGVHLLCTKLKSPTALEMRQLKRLLRYVKGTEDMSSVFEMRDNNDTKNN